MNPIDIVLAAVLAAVVAAAIVFRVRSAKRGGCGCGCADCEKHCALRDIQK